MGAEQIVSLVASLLGIVSQVAPGVLALLTGHATDAAALVAAESAVRALHPRRAGSAIDRVAAEIGRAKTDPPPDGGAGRQPMPLA